MCSEQNRLTQLYQHAQEHPQHDDLAVLSPRQQFKEHCDLVMGYTDFVASHSASASFAVRVRRRTVCLSV